ncbi:mechanosensitive ion channel domain-containing protein [Halopseudomonas sp.]|jgi:small-conductance mechanosensitive channel|uniref:mechanosensitive ion channel domain-containing protein n=1 Tax=Halopseudomonas sp. TaxID=2901191 RepID=UPI0039E2BFAC
MYEWLDTLPASIVISDSVVRLLLSTAILMVVTLVLRALVSRLIRQKVNSVELRRKWLVNSRNGFLLLMLLGLVMIWGEELRTLALSIVAIAVAFVVATKELILCVIGSIIKTGSRSFNLGDRIQVKDFRGDVIDQSLLTTTILEVGPGKHVHQRSGRVVVIPNALFVSEPVINESFTHEYDFHVFTVPFKRRDDWRSAQTAFLESANRHCAPYLEAVRQYMTRIGRNRGLETPSVNPRVTIQTPVSDEIHLVIRFPTKAGQRGYMEQTILTEVFANNDFLAAHPEPAAEVPTPTETPLS